MERRRFERKMVVVVIGASIILAIPLIEMCTAVIDFFTALFN
jgi:hypothetical protein